MTYRVKSGLFRIITAVGFTVAKVQKKRKLSPSFLLRTFRDKLTDIDRVGIPQKEHDQFFPYSFIHNIQTTANLRLIKNQTIVVTQESLLKEEPIR